MQTYTTSHLNWHSDINGKQRMRASEVR